MAGWFFINRLCTRTRHPFRSRLLQASNIWKTGADCQWLWGNRALELTGVKFFFQLNRPKLHCCSSAIDRQRGQEIVPRFVPFSTSTMKSSTTDTADSEPLPRSHLEVTEAHCNISSAPNADNSDNSHSAARIDSDPPPLHKLGLLSRGATAFPSRNGEHEDSS